MASSPIVSNDSLDAELRSSEDSGILGSFPSRFTTNTIVQVKSSPEHRGRFFTVGSL